MASFFRPFLDDTVMDVDWTINAIHLGMPSASIANGPTAVITLPLICQLSVAQFPGILTQDFHSIFGFCF
jgi:hypothetical protein